MSMPNKLISDLKLVPLTNQLFKFLSSIAQAKVGPGVTFKQMLYWLFT